MKDFDAVKTKNEIVEWIRNYFSENGKDCCAVVGISGGKDSSIVASLCAEALGKERVFGVLMPRGVQHDLDVAKELVSSLGINYCIVNINDTVNSLIAAVSGAGQILNRQAEINTPARIRMTVLYAIAAVVNGRVANTCNLSEDWVGYSTKFGDGAGDFSPLSNLTVTELKQIGRVAGLTSKFIDKIPEDGLTGLSDEENLGFSYDVLDRYIREGICEDTQVKEKIDRLYRLSRHKLSLMPSFMPEI